MAFAFTSFICPSETTRQADRVLPLKELPDWTVRRYTTEKDITEDWPAADRSDDFWLQPAVLDYQLSNPQGISTVPLEVTNVRDGRRVLLTAQSFHFSAAGQVSDAAKGETSGYDLRRRLLAPFSFRVLTLGQFLVSGNYASSGLDQLTREETLAVLPALADTLLASDRSFAAVLIKDLYALNSPVTEALTTRGFYLLPADPILQVAIPATWASLEDYLANLKSKYRVRYRRARAKLEGLTRRPLTAAMVGHHRERIYQLYKHTSSGSDFNAVALTPTYFPWLAEHGRDGATRFHGYFDAAGTLVAFTSTIANGPTLHAHFLGIEDACKSSHHLYHNILFDLLEDAITGGFAVLDYARTAPEIKTSVGATATEYACLLRARSGVINRLIPMFTPAVYKATPWTPRNPFR